ncbi:hypothetical protein [Herbaspirillum lusitanum]|uniref:hypothetical protein n=1 Tax=Herbaspirillum lusitanum TaxID=213312 RepID=UPI00223907E6|nr:hypothetical protein [Herbaspirillum lusitanum]
MKFKPKHERKFWRMAGGTAVPSTQFNDGMAEVARLFQVLQPRLTVNVDDKQYRLHRAADRQSRIPAIYVPASWRNTTPVDDSTDEIGIGFETRDGIIRLRLSVDSANHLADSVADYINSYACRTHSDGPAALPKNQKVTSTLKPVDVWQIERAAERYIFRRIVNGVTAESYRPVTRDVASVWAISIIQDFQPPRHLQHSDKPVG